LPTPKVVIDTSVWVDFFRGTANSKADAIEKLVRSGRAVTCGIVQAELLAGIRDESERERLRQGMSGIEYVETTRSTWTKAGNLAAELRSRGLTLPLSDLVLAAIAVESGYLILSADRHFTRIPGVKLYKSA
jgi:predicted nucleic acid-binding protein